jgi:hypothetical protein
MARRPRTGSSTSGHSRAIGACWAAPGSMEVAAPVRLYTLPTLAASRHLPGHHGMEVAGGGGTAAKYSNDRTAERVRVHPDASGPASTRPPTATARSSGRSGLTAAVTATRRADPRSAVNRPTHSPAWVDGHGRTEGPGPGLQIRRSDRDELGLARMLPAPDESACALQGDHEQRSRADWLTAATSSHFRPAQDSWL